MRWAPWVLGLVVLAGCEAEGAALVVQLRTDLVPGREFIGVRTEYATGPFEDAPSVRRQDAVATAADDFVVGQQVAELLEVTPGPAYLRVTLLGPSGDPVAVRRLIAAIEQRTAVTVVVTRSCGTVRCPLDGDPASATECIGGACADPRCAPEAPEHCPASACATGADCPPAPGCEVARCVVGACFEVPEDARCGAGEACDPVDGCVEDVAVDAGTPDDGGAAGDAGCPAVEAACDDGLDDDCDGATDCADEDCAGAACDDGIFCNGADQCGAGACSVHPTPACPVACDEATATCLDCAVDADCGAPTLGAWSDCAGFAEPCGEVGTRARDVTTPTCVAGTCMDVPSTEMEACSRTTEGTTCGAMTCPGWGACGWSSTCDESATQSRTCTAYECRSGTCAGVDVPQSQGCSRDTDGSSCGTTTCTGYGACNWSSTCDESATQSRTCTSYACAGGTCRSSSSPQSRTCTRNTDGLSCVVIPGCGARCVGGLCDPICSTGCPC